MRRLLLASALFASGLPLHAAETCVTLDDKSVAALFDDLNFALSSLDTRQVTQRYWPNAMLLPTDSSIPRTTAETISKYYEHFLSRRPRGHIDTRSIQSSCNMAVDMGTYTFSLMDDKGATTKESARYSIIYQYRDGAWKILNQQSSPIPEASMSDARVASVDPATAAPPANTESPKAQQRKSKRKDYLDDAPVAAKPAEKPSVPVVEAKPSIETPVATEAKASPEAKSPADSKAAAPTKAVDAKATPAVKPAPATAPPVDAKHPPEVRTAMFANLAVSAPPSKFYPPEAMRHKERGSVNLKVCANGEGAVSESLEVLKSSGSKLLDEAAITWARNATWVPATFNRQRVEGCTKVEVAFEPPPALAHARR